MADGKKSFVLYVDWQKTVELLSNDKAGILFKHILKYVNDLNPKTDDMIIKIAFEPIKQQLKRDLIKWRGIREERVRSGKKGGLKSGESRSNRSKPNQTKEMLQKRSKPKQTEANEAVNVNVNVNDSVNVNVNEKKKVNNIPQKTEFLEYAEKLCEKAKLSFQEYEFSLQAKFESWVGDGWKDGNGSKIINWKNKLGSVLPYLKPIKDYQKTKEDLPYNPHYRGK